MKVHEILQRVDLPPSDWKPSEETLMNIFNSMTTQIFTMPPHYVNIMETAPISYFVESPQIIPWLWDKHKFERKSLLAKFMTIYNFSSYCYGGVRTIERKALPADTKKEIHDLCIKCFDVLSANDSLEREVHELRISILNLIQGERTINYTEHLMFAYLSNNLDMINFWTSNGLSSSRDPEFYSLLWGKIVRKQDYVEARSSVIDAAFKCDFYPECIINDMVIAGHTKNKVKLVGGIVSKLDMAEIKKHKQISLGLDLSDPDGFAEIEAAIKFHRKTLGRFAGNENYDVLKSIFRHLSKEDQIFAAPACVNQGLGNYIDKFLRAKE